MGRAPRNGAPAGRNNTSRDGRPQRNEGERAPRDGAAPRGK